MNAEAEKVVTALHPDRAELRNVLRMPAVLGPAPGPRNMPASKAHRRYEGDTLAVTVTALVERTALSAILPPRCRLAGEALLDVCVMKQTRLGWLAGRGYNIVALRIPVLCDTPGGETAFNFTPVLWENMADPILTGREELGSPKLFANIPDPMPQDGGYRCSADWEGFRFLDLEVTAMRVAELAPPPMPPQLLYRYFSRIGDWEHPAVAELTRANKGGAPTPKLNHHLTGSGRFVFHAATWEDMPTQYTFINTLASLPLLEFRGARVTHMSGIPDIAAQTIVD